MSDTNDKTYKQERGSIVGDQIIAEKYELWGKITGDVRVVDGGKFYHRGVIYGDLTVDKGGRVHTYGPVTGSLYVFKGAKVIVSGIISGNVTNDGGRIYVDRDGQITGKVKTLSGETEVEVKDVYTEE